MAERIRGVGGARVCTSIIVAAEVRFGAEKKSARRLATQIATVLAAIEILLNTPTVAEKIFKGEFHELKAVMAKSRELGMRTFDWALFELYNEGLIGYEDAIRNSDLPKTIA